MICGLVKWSIFILVSRLDVCTSVEQNLRRRRLYRGRLGAVETTHLDDLGFSIVCGVVKWSIFILVSRLDVCTTVEQNLRR